LIGDAMHRGWIGEGPKVAEFQRALCDKFDWRYCKAVNSGTAALRLALVMAGVGPGDEVITTPNTCSATGTAIMECLGKTSVEKGEGVIFADIQPNTGNIDPTDIIHRITPRTKAIMCVHWAGYPVDLYELHHIANAYGLIVVEDAAHAQGATYHSRPIGTISRFTCFSFQAIKTLTTGDGGALVLLDEADYDRARRLSWFGIDREQRRQRPDGYWFWNQTEAGFKYHMNDIAASIGLANLDHFDVLYFYRAQLAMFYRRALENTPGVTLFECKPDRTSGHWLFTLHAERRDDFIRMLRDKGIEASVVHIRNDVHDCFGGRRDDLPNMDKYEQTHVSIPLGWWVSLENAQTIVDAIRGGW